jgi:hypothetical protein
MMNASYDDSSDESEDENSIEIDYPDEPDESDDEPDYWYQPVRRKKQYCRMRCKIPYAPTPTRVDSRFTAGTDCVICLEVLTLQTSVYCQFRCGQAIHRACVDGLSKCPLCRYKGAGLFSGCSGSN